MASKPRRPSPAPAWAQRGELANNGRQMALFGNFLGLGYHPRVRCLPSGRTCGFPGRGSTHSSSPTEACSSTDPITSPLNHDTMKYALACAGAFLRREACLKTVGLPQITLQTAVD